MKFFPLQFSLWEGMMSEMESAIKNSKGCVNPEVRDRIYAVVRRVIYEVIVFMPVMGRWMGYVDSCNRFANLVVIKLTWEHESSSMRHWIRCPNRCGISIIAVASNTRGSKAVFEQIIWTSSVVESECSIVLCLCWHTRHAPDLHSDIECLLHRQFRHPSPPELILNSPNSFSSYCNDIFFGHSCQILLLRPQNYTINTVNIYTIIQ